jgi:hypothetical protein
MGRTAPKLAVQHIVGELLPRTQGKEHEKDYSSIDSSKGII